LAGIRVALIFAAGYVVISVVGLIVGRRWLAELGPSDIEFLLDQVDTTEGKKEGE
jgi:hypothetical protein